MEVVLAKSVKKQYKKLPQKVQKRVKLKLVSLKGDALAGKQLKGVLKGLRSLRIWPYRLIYKVNKKDHRLEIVALLHRKEVYKKLKS